MYMNVADVNKVIAEEKKHNKNFVSGDISDTHHTFRELYDGRAVMSAVICNTYSHLSWKSRQHEEGGDPMFDGMFVVGVETPEGSYTNHYHLDMWDMFTVTELEYARPWDGHTAADIKRLLSLLTN